MNKRKLSKLLKEAGSSFKEFETEVKKQNKRIRYDCGLDVIDATLRWSTTMQGHKYWEKIHNHIVDSLYLITESQWSLDYPLTKDWWVGWHHLDKKSRKLLFSVLAEDLGYEIEK